MASAPYVNSPLEGILILFKNHWHKDNKGISDITGKEFMQACSGVWKLQPEMNGLTKANFPVSLPMRCIKLLSYKGDIVLDPFSGSGTTAYAAKVTGRQYIGFELSENYWKIGNRRLEQNGLDSWLEPEPEGTLGEFV
jgi:site-specific DNA-methyltransferase (adenine-specific)